MPEKKKGFDLVEKLKEVSSLNTSDAGREQIQYIHVEHILPDERNFYDLSGIDELAASIELVGLQQPLRVRPYPDHEGAYIIVSGHRRHAALKKLIGESQELYDRFCNAPCIVERQTGAGDEVEVWLQELRLIYGNSDTRKMSSADLSKQAERVEMLLYQLKEAGMEFPGKMRDHVAEACKVSASKLARLKVIRENLEPALREEWERGELRESVAYAFAQQSPEVQARLILYLARRLGGSRSCWSENHVRVYADRIKKELKLKCKEASGGCCDHTDERLTRMACSGVYGDHCYEGKCCHRCPNLGTCAYPCLHLGDEVTDAQEKAKTARAAEKARKDKENDDIVAPKRRLWLRFGEARKAAGLTWEEYAKKADVVAFRREKKVEDFEQGCKLTPSSGGLPYAGGDGVDEWRIQPLVKAADALGCSVDYLLCRTDIREMAAGTTHSKPTTDKPRWILGAQSPKEYGSYLCKIDLGGKVMTLTGIYDPYRAKWLHPADGEPIPYPVLGWYPIPPEDGEVSNFDTGEGNDLPSVEEGGSDHD